ncbi:MAG: AbrB/MazE/SpoVT family DNA-binding domain-containing protein [Thermoflexibacteraceae bacterium]|jgi:antitoxin MazE
MQISVVQIGNSKGIRLSKTLLEKYQITDKVELILEDDFIVLKPVVVPRKNWEEAFAEMHRNGDDTLLIDSVLEDENWD